MARDSIKKTKTCLVCGTEFKGIETANTCGSACRTTLSRLLKKGKKPQYWLIAKNKGQKLPLFFAAPMKKEDNKPEPEKPPVIPESDKKVYDSPPPENKLSPIEELRRKKRGW